MAHSFEITKDLEVDATPEEVWDAISTGRGVDSWFMGRNEIEPREGGTVTSSVGGATETSTVTRWEPKRRFVWRSAERPDGSFHQFDYRIEPRDAGSTSIRFVHSGMLDPDWEREYEKLTESFSMFVYKLVEYLTYFRGRFATPVNAFGPNTDKGREAAMATFQRGLGVPDNVAVGDRVRLTPEAMAPIDGVVDYLSPGLLGVRTDDALLRFICGDEKTMVVGHLFDDVDQRQAEADWEAWLTRLFGS